MNLNNFFYKIAHIFEIKKHTEQEYQIKNEDLNFFNIPMSVILVVKKYGWVVFYHKLINYGKLIFHKYHAKLNRLYVETRNSFKREGALRVFKRTWNYIFYGKGVLNRNEFIKGALEILQRNQEIPAFCFFLFGKCHRLEKRIQYFSSSLRNIFRIVARLPRRY